VVEFFAGEKNIYIIEAANGNVAEVRKLDSAQKLKQAVKDIAFTYFQQGAANMMNAPEKYYRDAYNIYHWLWPDSLRKKQAQCIIIPDGIFGYLPFDALVTDPHYVADPGQWPFLINNTNLYYSYSLQTAQQLEKLSRPYTNFAGFFVSFDSSQQSSLPAVKKEYDAIGDVVKGDFFRESEASLAAFKKCLSKVNLLHISTHSFLQGKENLPVLQLSDDKFFLFELYGKAFQPQLVVLSACRTGHGMLAEGEGIISLARGFTATGAEGIVAGLWNMNDEAAAQISGAFYSRLAVGDLPAAALREAKLQWLHQQKIQAFQKLPYFWAGMIYSGDNRKVEMDKKKGGTQLWLIAAIVVGLTAVIFILRRKKMGNGQ
jgi:CHAT domain-containing protein